MHSARWLVLKSYSRPKPDAPPENYRRWPLCLGAAFIHNGHFGEAII